MAWLFDPQAWIALATLTALEIVLGIDNIIFISVLVSRLPERRRQKARIIGLALAMISRIVLLLSLVWIMTLTVTLFTLFGHEFSGRDFILLGGGIFLFIKSTFEIHNSLESTEDVSVGGYTARSFFGVLMEIMVLDIVFSLDSVITAVGLAQHVHIMILAIIIAVVVMMFAAGPIGTFVDMHPTIKMLALSFLILIGVTLVAEGMGFHIPKGYIYFAVTFSVCVEMLNLKIIKKQAEPVRLRKVRKGQAA
ncbi:MAG TPA: TerC family protein [Syntrophales bacterium]|nr:TerC family protein [Syntrophales bacterium]HPQ45175.1 TerC family protein [Syntrophales bacterium]